MSAVGSREARSGRIVTIQDYIGYYLSLGRDLVQNDIFKVDLMLAMAIRSCKRDGPRKELFLKKLIRQQVEGKLPQNKIVVK